MPYALVAFGWVAFYILHSVLASFTIKNLAAKHLGKAYPAYRLTYNLFNLLLFVFLVYQQQQLPVILLFEPTHTMAYGGWILLVTGFVIGFFSFSKYSLKEFSGWQQITQSKQQQLNLNTGGLNKYVRHPLYLATILLLLGYWLLKPHASATIFVSISFVYLYVGTRLEEQKLINQFGKTYLNYMQTTPMFFPRLWR